MLIWLDVIDILPSPLAPLVVTLPVPESVCEIQAPALITMAKASPQPHSVDVATYSRVNPLPSPATSSSSSGGELPLFIWSDSNSPAAIPPGTINSSQELLIKGQQPPQQPSWADEVAAEQSECSTPETVVQNCSYSGRVRGPKIRAPETMSVTTRMRTPRYESPTVPPRRPLQQVPQPPLYERPTCRDHYP